MFLLRLFVIKQHKTQTQTLNISNITYILVICRYTYDKRYDKALGIYLRLRHPDVFELIHKHNLFDSISDKIELLMAFEPTEATKMLLDNVTKVPVSLHIWCMS